MTVMRALLIMPVTIAPVVVGFLFRYLFAPEGGVVPWVLTSIGVPVPAAGLLGSPLHLAAEYWHCRHLAMDAVLRHHPLRRATCHPHDMTDAAKVDGAGWFNMLWHITLPLLRPVAAFLIMIRFMQIFNSFDLVYVLTGGGPGTSSRTLSFNLYQEGLVNYNIGLTAAMTWLDRDHRDHHHQPLYHLRLSWTGVVIMGKATAKKVMLYALAALAMFVFIGPIVWFILLAFRQPGDTYRFRPQCSSRPR